MPATQPQWSRTGEQWADLCQYHESMLSSAMLSCDVTRIGREWLAAQGGIAVLAKRMAP